MLPSFQSEAERGESPFSSPRPWLPPISHQLALVFVASSFYPTTVVWGSRVYDAAQKSIACALAHVLRCDSGAVEGITLSIFLSLRQGQLQIRNDYSRAFLEEGARSKRCE